MPLNPFEKLIRIPGPNPILRTGGPGEWDEGRIECGDVFEEFGTYYLYYHGQPLDGDRWKEQGYRIGVATAPHPLGPWTKHPGNPILDLGETFAWDDVHVACPCLLKEGVDRYYLWYSGFHTEWSIGLATGPGPLGPFTRYTNRPLLPKFGYVGGVVREGGQYRLYAEHPIGATGPDYGPLALAIAERPEGPWTPGPTVLTPGAWGAWDDGGYSEAKVLRLDGGYHVFYGGAKLHPTRLRSEESIGHAWSPDGVTFHKDSRNPVAPRQREPNAAAYAEVHALYETPFIYCYHTLRYQEAERVDLEHLGVQILATRQPYCLTIPVLNLPLLRAGEEAESAVIGLAQTSDVGVVPSPREELRWELWGSADGQRYESFARDIIGLHRHAAFAKVRIRADHDAVGVTVTAVLRG